MDLRPVLFVIGLLLSIMSVSMFIPMLTDLYHGSSDWRVFFLCITMTAFFGGSLVISSAQENFTMNVRQAFLLTGSSWVVLGTFAAFPFYFSNLQMSMTDSFFEAISGITTTGATVIIGLDNAPPGILLWRAILQWLGGIGIIVMALSVLPFLKVGGMQLFRTESSESEKALPRAAKLASTIGLIYLGLTLVCMIFYMFSGLTAFHALAHAMTTIATGGYSTFDTSFAGHSNIYTEMVGIIFMLMGGMPFVLYVKALGGNIRPILRDTQVRVFLGIVFTTTVFLATYLLIHHQATIGTAIVESLFSVTSVITGTGYSNADYGLWGSFSVSVFFFLMVVGGCAGSTTCGIKIFRFQVLYAIITVQFKRLLFPNGVFIPYYNGRPIPEDVPLSVMSFFFVYALCFALLSLALSSVGLDFLTATSGAVSAISNVGPGLGPIIGPAGTYKALPDMAKWILCFGMLLGRLELFTILVFLLPHFWRR